MGLATFHTRLDDVRRQRCRSVCRLHYPRNRCSMLLSSYHVCLCISLVFCLFHGCCGLWFVVYSKNDSKSTGTIAASWTSSIQPAACRIMGPGLLVAHADLPSCNHFVLTSSVGPDAGEVHVANVDGAKHALSGRPALDHTTASKAEVSVFYAERGRSVFSSRSRRLRPRRHCTESWPTINAVLMEIHSRGRGCVDVCLAENGMVQAVFLSFSGV